MIRKKARKRPIPKNGKPPRKSPDIPVTQEMLNEARNELKHEITSFRLEVDSRFKRVDAAIAKVQSDVAKVQSDVAKVQSDVAKVLAAVHRVGLLVEEQNARNKYVLDGYTSLSDRLDKIEKENKDI
jgi:hypothetical protein